MTAPRKTCLRLVPLSLLLVSAGALAGAHEVALHGPNGNGGDCDPAVPAPVAAPVDTKPSTVAGKAPTTSIKPVVTVRGGDESGGQAPRWHSFLPGMFR